MVEADTPDTSAIKAKARVFEPHFLITEPMPIWVAVAISRAVVMLAVPWFSFGLKTS